MYVLFLVAESRSTAGIWKSKKLLLLTILSSKAFGRSSEAIQLRTVSRSFVIYKFHILKRGVRMFFCAYIRSLNQM